MEDKQNDEIIEKPVSRTIERTVVSDDNPDFANGKGNDPRARGAESSSDFIQNG